MLETRLQPSRTDTYFDRTENVNDGRDESNAKELKIEEKMFVLHPRRLDSGKSSAAFKIPLQTFYSKLRRLSNVDRKQTRNAIFISIKLWRWPSWWENCLLEKLVCSDLVRLVNTAAYFISIWRWRHEFSNPQYPTTNLLFKSHNSWNLKRNDPSKTNFH